MNSSMSSMRAIGGYRYSLCVRRAASRLRSERSLSTTSRETRSLASTMSSSFLTMPIMSETADLAFERRHSVSARS